MSIQYGTRTEITITLASLAAASYREGAEVSNATPLDEDANLMGFITTGTSPAAGGVIEVLIWGGDGTTRAANAGGADAAYTSGGEDSLLRLAVAIPTDTTSNHRYDFCAGSIAALFGGVLPPRWGVVVRNGTSVALNATGGNHGLFYQSVGYAA